MATTVLGNGVNFPDSITQPTASPKAWVTINGTTSGSIRASFNVSSVTYNGTGDFTVNFSTAMPDANFVTCGLNGGTAGCDFMTLYQASFPNTTTSSRILTFNYATGNRNALISGFVFFR